MAAVALSVVALVVFFVLKRKTDKDQLAQSVKVIITFTIVNLRNL